MIGPPTVLERFSRVAPIGIRFWDNLTRTVVGDGLRVTAVHADYPARTIQAWPNRSGVFVVQHVPQLRDFAFGNGDEAFWDRFPPSQPYIFTVEDMLRRFLPLRFTAEIPVQGLFVLDCLPIESPPSAPPDTIPLFSAPSRIITGGLAVLYADLWDATNDRPAAWSVLELSDPQMPTIRGMADREGRIALPFPYPEPPTPPVSSPTGGTRRALANVSWTLQLDTFYAPQTPIPEAPDMCSVLTQAAAQMWTDAGQTQPLTTVQLDFGRPVVMRSDLPPEFKPQSVALITPM